MQKMTQIIVLEELRTNLYQVHSLLMLALHINLTELTPEILFNCLGGVDHIVTSTIKMCEESLDHLLSVD